MTRVATLESQSQFLTDRGLKLILRRQIAEGLARCFDNHPREDAEAALNEAELQLRARNKETAWGWYFSYAYKFTALSMLAFVVFWLKKALLVSYVGETAFEVVLGVLSGTLGALLSVTSRGDRLVMDANAGKRIHELEGMSRIGAGVIGALFVILAIKSGLILGGVKFTGSKLALLLTFGVAAGASERMVPNLIDSFEKMALNSEEGTHPRGVRDGGG